MGKKLYIANWKSHKKTEEALDFLDELKKKIHTVDLSDKEIIIAPPFTLLCVLKDFIDKHSLPIKLAGQDVSSFPEGAYTGEVAAQQLKEFCNYVIIGHSERKRYQHETESEIQNKVDEAKREGLTVVLCVQGEKSHLYKEADIIAFEPPSAISTFGVGDPEDPKEIEEVFNSIREDMSSTKLLYGGSVSVDNISQYKAIPHCSGFLIGSASLDPHSFIELLK